MLCEQGVVPQLAALLCSPHSAVLMPTLLCLTDLTHENQKVSAAVVITRYFALVVEIHSRNESLK